MPDLMDQLYDLSDVVGHVPGVVLDYLEWVAMRPTDDPCRRELIRLCAEVVG